MTRIESTDINDYVQSWLTFLCVCLCTCALTQSTASCPQLSKALTDNLPNSLSCMGKARDVLLDWLLNPLTPRSDSHLTSPSDIWTLSSKQVMGILKLIR